MPTSICNDCAGPSEPGTIACENCTTVCVSCSRRIRTRRATQSGDDNWYCRSCYGLLYLNCEDCGCELSRNYDQIHNLEGEYLCGACYQDRYVECSNCSERIAQFEIRYTPDDNPHCTLCFDDVCAECRDCGRITWLEDTHGLRGDTYCRDCYNHSEWEDTGFYVENPTYAEIRSQRKFGVEFETSECPNHIDIRDDTCFGCKEDGSVDGMEFVSPVLYGDEGLEQIRHLCEHARNLGWSVDSACGFHVHFDLSNETNEDCFKVALAYHHTYDFWNCFVSNARQANYYCAKHFYTPASFAGQTNFERWVRQTLCGERYTWVNLSSYSRFRTVELRNHSATLNATKVINWIKAHTRFIDKVVTMSRAEIVRTLGGRDVYDQFNAISGWWDDPELSTFYKQRAEQFRKPIRPSLTVATV